MATTRQEIAMVILCPANISRIITAMPTVVTLPATPFRSPAGKVEEPLLPRSGSGSSGSGSDRGQTLIIMSGSGSNLDYYNKGLGTCLDFHNWK